MPHRFNKMPVARIKQMGGLLETEEWGRLAPPVLSLGATTCIRSQERTLQTTGGWESGDQCGSQPS